jgi:RNA polymerase sigma-B factor
MSGSSNITEWKSRRTRAVKTDHWRLGSYTAPPAEEVQALVERYRSGGCLASRDRVVECHMQMVAHFAKRHAGPRVAFDDLMAEGAVILLRAVDLYDPERGVPFSAYAAAVLKAGLLGATSRMKDGWKMRAWAARKRATREVRVGPAAAEPQVLGAAAMINSIANGSTPVERAERADAVEKMEAAIGQLSPGSAAVLCKRFGVLGEREHSANELGEALRLEPRMVNRLLLRAMAELREQLSRDGRGKEG